jgi:hypothetical protein
VVRLGALLADADLAVLIHREPLASGTPPVGVVLADLAGLEDLAGESR